MNPPRGLGKKTAQLREIIAKRYTEGASLRQIGAELGRTPSRRPRGYHRSSGK